MTSVVWLWGKEIKIYIILLSMKWKRMANAFQNKELMTEIRARAAINYCCLKSTVDSNRGNYVSCWQANRQHKFIIHICQKTVLRTKKKEVLSLCSQFYISLILKYFCFYYCLKDVTGYELQMGQWKLMFGSKSIINFYKCITSSF